MARALVFLFMRTGIFSQGNRVAAIRVGFLMATSPATAGVMHAKLWGFKGIMTTHLQRAALCRIPPPGSPSAPA